MRTGSGRILAVGALTLLAACGGATKSGGGPSSTPPQAPPRTYIGGQPLVCGVDSGPSGAFPAPTASAEERPVSSSDLEGFIVAFASFNHIPEFNAVVVPGTARRADVASNRTQWGLATFALRPGAAASGAGLNAFSPPYNVLAFVRTAGCPWTHSGPLTVPFPCPNATIIPAGVQHAWHLKDAPAAACAKVSWPPSPR